MTPEQVRHARALLTQPDASIASIARLLGVSRSTIYKYLPELKTGGDRQAIEVSAARAELTAGDPAYRPQSAASASARNSTGMSRKVGPTQRQPTYSDQAVTRSLSAH